MDKEQRLPTRLPFPADDAGRAFEKDLSRFIQREFDLRMEALISPENHLSMHHGHGWTFQRKDDVSADGEISRHHAETQLSTQSIVEHDLKIVREFVERIVSELEDQAQASLFESAKEAAEGVGNVVDSREGQTVADRVLALLRKMEFGVDREGEVTLPTVVLSPEDTRRLSGVVANGGAQFKTELEAIIAEKGEQAKRLEAERLARYRTRGDGDQ